MKKERSEEELFEKMPVPKAVATLAVPTIIGQIVTMIYNLADTFFVGQMGNPYMVAAVSLVSPWFNLLTALGNLFGLGGGITTLLFSLLTYLFRHPLLSFLGASSGTYGICAELSALGCRIGRRTDYVESDDGKSVKKRRACQTGKHRNDVWRHFKCSFRSRSDFRFSSGCSRSSNCDVIIKLAAGYGDIPVAAYGIVKRIDQFPLNISMGLCQGFMPLVGYNFASGNYKRMREVSFLRIACIAVPFTSANFLISYTLQAMGKGMQSGF